MRLIQSMELRVPQKKTRPWQPRNRRNCFSRWWSQKAGQSLPESASISRLALTSQCLSLIFPMPLTKTESEPIASDLLGQCTNVAFGGETSVRLLDSDEMVAHAGKLYVGLRDSTCYMCCTIRFCARRWSSASQRPSQPRPPCLVTSLADLFYLVWTTKPKIT